MKNTNPTQHRTKDGRRETKQGENMIQIIVLNIAKCNYINETATAQAWAWARLPTMQPSLRNIPIYLVFLSFVVGASKTISLHFCFKSVRLYAAQVHPIWHTPFDFYLIDVRHNGTGLKCRLKSKHCTCFSINKLHRAQCIDIKQPTIDGAGLMAVSAYVDGSVRIHGDSRRMDVVRFS